MRNIVLDGTEDDFAHATMRMKDISDYVGLRSLADDMYVKWPLCRP